MTFAAALEALGFVDAGPFSGRHDRADGVKAYHCHDLVRMQFNCAVILVAGRRTACVEDPAALAAVLEWWEPRRCNGPAAGIVSPVSTESPLRRLQGAVTLGPESQ